VQSCPSGCPLYRIIRTSDAHYPRAQTPEQECLRILPDGSSGWECLDTSLNLKACGGGTYSGVGDDCSALPYRSYVAGVEGNCEIQAGNKRHALFGTVCVPIFNTSQRGRPPGQ
jgi:hypothetical protein